MKTKFLKTNFWKFSVIFIVIFNSLFFFVLFVVYDGSTFDNYIKNYIISVNAIIIVVSIFKIPDIFSVICIEEQGIKIKLFKYTKFINWNQIDSIKYRAFYNRIHTSSIKYLDFYDKDKYKLTRIQVDKNKIEVFIKYIKNEKLKVTLEVFKENLN